MQEEKTSAILESEKSAGEAAISVEFVEQHACWTFTPTDWVGPPCKQEYWEEGRHCMPAYGWL